MTLEMHFMEIELLNMYQHYDDANNSSSFIIDDDDGIEWGDCTYGADRGGGIDEADRGDGIDGTDGGGCIDVDTFLFIIDDDDDGELDVNDPDVGSDGSISNFSSSECISPRNIKHLLHDSIKHWWRHCNGDNIKLENK